MINLKSMEDVQRIIAEVESVDNKLRKRREWISEQVDDGNLYWYAREEVKRMYPQTFDAYTISEYSLSKKIYDRKARSYKEKPARKLPIDTESKEYNKILDDNRFNTVMRKFDRLYNRHKYALLAVFPDIKGRDQASWSFKAIAPYIFDCVFDEEGELQAVILSYPDKTVRMGPNTDGSDSIIAETGDADEGSNSTIYTMWTAQEHAKFKVKKDKGTKFIIESIEVPGNPEGKNPFGVLPFVYAPKDGNVNYPVASPLASQVITLNALMSIYLTSGNLQIGQLVLKYPEGKDIKYVTQGLMTAIKLPQSTNPDDPDTEANYISPSPDLAGHKDSIVTYAQMILDEQGMTGAQVAGETQEFNSGFDRLLANADVQSIIEDNQGLYLQIEEDVYEIVKKIFFNFYGQNKFKSEDLQVIFARPKVLITDTEKLNNLKTMRELGLIEEWEKFTIFDPNISETEAKLKLGRVEQEKKDRVDMFAPLEVDDGNDERGSVETDQPGFTGEPQ